MVHSHCIETVPIKRLIFFSLLHLEPLCINHALFFLPTEGYVLSWFTNKQKKLSCHADVCSVGTHWLRRRAPSYTAYVHTCWRLLFLQ